MRRLLLLTALLFLIAMPRVVLAQERTVIDAPGWTASIGAGGWFTWGESKWEHEIEILPGISGGSRLTFKDVTSNLVTVDADVVLWRRLVLVASGGWGQANDGDLIDEDFILGTNFSRTRSAIDDGRVYFGTIDAGYRLSDWTDAVGRRGFVDLLVGYQYWQEKYEAFGIVDFLGFTGNEPRSTKVITETWTWHSLRIGGRAYFPFPYGLGVRGSAFVMPWNSVEVEDIHHLRTDLRQNPSIVLDGTGGFGWQLEGAITYTFWRGLGVEAGYRHWSVEMKSGDATFRPVNAGESDEDLRKVRTQRGGPFVGLYWRF
jgi:outer membrane protein Pom